MSRAGLFCLSSVLALIAVAPEASAKSKSYCRDYARAVADDRANAGDVVAGAVIGAVGGALLGAAIDGGSGAGKGALIGGAGGAVVTGVTANDRWQQVYRRAYAECRAS